MTPFIASQDRRNSNSLQAHLIIANNKPERIIVQYSDAQVSSCCSVAKGPFPALAIQPFPFHPQLNCRSIQLVENIWRELDITIDTIQLHHRSLSHEPGGDPNR